MTVDFPTASQYADALFTNNRRATLEMTTNAALDASYQAAEICPGIIPAFWELVREEIYKIAATVADEGQASTIERNREYWYENND